MGAPNAPFFSKPLLGPQIWSHFFPRIRSPGEKQFPARVRAGSVTLEASSAPCRCLKRGSYHTLRRKQNLARAAGSLLSTHPLLSKSLPLRVHCSSPRAPTPLRSKKRSRAIGERVGNRLQHDFREMISSQQLHLPPAPAWILKSKGRPTKKKKKGCEDEAGARPTEQT